MFPILLPLVSLPPKAGHIQAGRSDVIFGEFDVPGVVPGCFLGRTFCASKQGLQALGSELLGQSLGIPRQKNGPGRDMQMIGFIVTLVAWFARIGNSSDSCESADSCYKNRGFSCEWFARIDSRESRCESPVPLRLWLGLGVAHSWKITLHTSAGPMR